jgi:hypothetical protein
MEEKGAIYNKVELIHHFGRQLVVDGPETEAEEGSTYSICEGKNTTEGRQAAPRD